MSKSLCYQMVLSLPSPTSDDKRADVERLKEASGLRDLKIPLSLMRMLPQELRRNNYKISPLFAISDAADVLVEIDAEQFWGLAIDIGTTNIVASLHDLKAMEEVGKIRLVNPQTTYGVDLLSRIHYAMTGKLDEMRETLVRGLNRLIGELTQKAGISSEGIYAVTIACNTVMTHFLLGLDVSTIPVEPYIPVVFKPGFFSAKDLGLTTNPLATVYIFPNAGSYVGGDIISGILSTGLFKSDLPSVLIDVGTNAEVVVGTKDWILVGAGAAGPALEGGILSSGMTAESGAIYRIDIDDKTKEVSYLTIEDAPAQGICGSGVIDLIAEMYRTGIIDRQGRFTEKAPLEVDENGEDLFVVAKGEHGLIGIKQREVENFLRSKAAMFTSLYVMLASLGLSFSDIERFYIAGALGSGVRVEKAILLGMLPDVDRERFVAVGNTSIAGARALLHNAELLKEIEMIHQIITYKEMNTDREFMSNFPSALFIPHTNPEVLKG